MKKELKGENKKKAVKKTQTVTKSKDIKEEQNKKGYFNDFIKAINNFIDYFDKKDFKDVLKVIVELLIIIFFIALLKLPFILFRDLTLNFFDVLGVSNSSLVGILIYRIVDIVYILLAIVLFIELFKKRFKDIKKR